MNTTFEMHGYREFIARLSDAEKRHMPFAAAKALTKTGRQAAVAETGHIEAIFDKPTPFTKRAVGVTPATKATLTTRIFVKDIQAKYLMQEATGGRRDFKSFEEKFAEGGRPQIALPGAGMQLNQYGNMSKAKIVRIAKDLNSYESAKRFFKGTPKGHKLPAGIYARTNDNRRITPLIRFATDAVYKKRFEFSAIAHEAITANFETNLITAWEAAMRG